MLRSLCFAALALLASGVHAVDEKLTAQQQRMKECNAQANRQKLLGGERQDFMSSCLRSHGDGPRQLSAQQEKMRTCNRTASDRELRGDERRDFMSQCLRAGRDSAAAGGTRR